MDANFIRNLAAGAGRIALLLAAATALGAMGSRPPAPPPAAQTCGPLLPFLVIGDSRATEKTIYGQSQGSAILFLAGLAIDADGAPNAYHPDDVSGLDALANAGRPGNWWALATDSRGKPIIQGPGDPYPGFYVSMTALTDPNVSDPGSPRRYVDARHIPFVVLPGGKKALKAYKDAGIKLGDVALVYNLRTRIIAAAIWADIGPSTETGEGSIKLAEVLGYSNTSPRSGGTHVRENVFVVFGDTAATYQNDANKIEAAARRLLEMWGGRARLEDCAVKLQSR